MPFLAEGKAILQKTWCYRNEKDISLDWDEELPPDIKLEFAKWMNLIPQISMTKHPRYLFEELQTPPEKNTLYLHVFCDAGETAFGIAAYIRYYLGDSTDSTYNTHKWMSKLIYSSSKVAPAKNKLSIPKKELNAIVLGSKKAKYLENIIQLPHDNVFLHTDSLVALAWIKQDHRKLRVYVSNRVKVIQDHEINLVFCPGEQNPADYVTKKTKPEKYVNTSFWQHGPKFLQEDTNWIIENFQNNIPHPTEHHSNEIESEVKQKIQVNNMIIKNTTSRIANLISRWENFQKIIRVTGHCLKAIARFTEGMINSDKRERLQIMAFSSAFSDRTEMPNILTPEQLEAAKLYHIREGQRNTFEDYSDLAVGNGLKKNSKLAQLNPTINENGLVVMQSRLDHHEFYPEQIRKPIILPRDTLITEKIVLDTHNNFSHAGPEICLRETKLQ